MRNAAHQSSAGWCTDRGSLPASRMAGAFSSTPCRTSSTTPMTSCQGLFRIAGASCRQLRRPNPTTPARSSPTRSASAAGHRGLSMRSRDPQPGGTHGIEVCRRNKLKSRDGRFAAFVQFSLHAHLVPVGIDFSIGTEPVKPTEVTPGMAASLSAMSFCILVTV